MSGVAGAGHFIAWENGCMLIGRALSITPMHSHYAIQIGVGAQHGIRFRPNERSPWTGYGAAVIASRQPHTMDATVVEYSAVIFIEPESLSGRALSARYGGEGIAAVVDVAFEDTAAALFATWKQHANGAATTTAAQRVIDVMAQGARASEVTDERIVRAVQYINSRLHSPLTLDEVAREACLSSSRFRHLFVEQTGTALRPYVLWRRFLKSWEIVMSGGSLSTAAHSAGFADAAHLTRTSNRMFGFPPSALQVNAMPESRPQAVSAARETQSI